MTMKQNDRLHIVQSSVLRSLLYATRARYSELRRAAGIESDTFKFHIRKLQRQGYVIKAEDGLYELTAEGKEFTGRLDFRGREIEQPKSSMLMVVRCSDYVIGHRRDREPFRDFWGIASAPLLRGMPAERSAERALKRQTGIDAVFRVAGTYRVIDRDIHGAILEDKLFVIMLADVPVMTTPSAWYGGYSEWMTVEKLLAHDRLFPTTSSTLDMITHGETFREEVCVYGNGEY